MVYMQAAARQAEQEKSNKEGDDEEGVEESISGGSEEGEGEQEDGGSGAELGEDEEDSSSSGSEGAEDEEDDMRPRDRKMARLTDELINGSGSDSEEGDGPSAEY